jgi:CDP-paratose 2-epimerase
MKMALITGSAGLIGAEAVRFFAAKGYAVAGIDNDMRRQLFGADASTEPSRRALESTVAEYRHHAVDIRDQAALERIFAEYGTDIGVVIHTAAQPSHDWAARAPEVDFAINALGTLGLLECVRKHSPRAAFLFTSTNKVYGDNPNRLPLIELESRWEIAPGHPFAEHGIDEAMSVDQTLHSLFGVSKLAADALVQEYGRYFGMNTVAFRCGCLTGPNHAGAPLHGFLSYLAKCAVLGLPYTVHGYKGKQVRDNIHAHDLVSMFWHYCQNPRPGEVYNVGGGRHANCSMQEAIAACKRLTGRPVQVSYSEANRVGDHIWYISDVRKFRAHYPAWEYHYDLDATLREIIDATVRQAAR